MLASLAATDTNIAAGQGGVVVIAVNNGSPLLGTWDDVAARVPEPAGILMLLSGGLMLGMMAVWRRRR